LEEGETNLEGVVEDEYDYAVCVCDRLGALRNPGD
jgi:hypothetical protein